MNSNSKVKKGPVHLLYMVIVVCIATACAATGDVFSSLVAAIVGGGFFAAACLYKFSFFTAFPMIAVPPIVTYFVTRELTLTFMSVSFLPVGIAIFYCISKGKTRSQTILTTTAYMTVFYAALYAIVIVSIFGFINGEAISNYIELNLDVVRESMEEARELYESSDMKNEFGGDEVFSPKFEETVIDSMRSSFGGYLLALFAIASFLATMITKGIAKKNGCFPLNCGSWKFVFSKPGAVVFLLAYFIGSIYVSETEGPYLPFAINTLCFSLYPAILYMGIGKIVSFFKRFNGVGGIVMFIIGFLLFGTFIMMLVIIAGVVAALSHKETPTENEA